MYKTFLEVKSLRIVIIKPNNDTSLLFLKVCEGYRKWIWWLNLGPALGMGYGAKFRLEAEIRAKFELGHGFVNSLWDTLFSAVQHRFCHLTKHLVSFAYNFEYMFIPSETGGKLNWTSKSFSTNTRSVMYVDLNIVLRCENVRCLYSSWIWTEFIQRRDSGPAQQVFELWGGGVGGAWKANK